MYDKKEGEYRMILKITTKEFLLNLMTFKFAVRAVACIALTTNLKTFTFGVAAEPFEQPFYLASLLASVVPAEDILASQYETKVYLRKPIRALACRSRLGKLQRLL